MPNLTVELNYLAILVAGIANMVVGFLWYSPFLFGNIWTKLSGFTKEAMEEAKKKGMGKTYALSFLLSLVTAYVLAHFVEYLNIQNIGGAVQMGFWIWLGFVLTTMGANALYDTKPAKLFWINILYHLVTFIIMAIIVAVWH